MILCKFYKKLTKFNLNALGCLNSDGDSHEMEGSTPCQCGPSLSFTSLLATFKHLSELNLFHCRNLHSAGTRSEQFLNLNIIQWTGRGGVGGFCG